MVLLQVLCCSSLLFLHHESFDYNVPASVTLVIRKFPFYDQVGKAYDRSFSDIPADSPVLRLLHSQSLVKCISFGTRFGNQ